MSTVTTNRPSCKRLPDLIAWYFNSVNKEMSNNDQTVDPSKEGQPQQPGTEKNAEKTINKRLQRTQAQVNEVVDIMRVNIEKVLERDKNLSQLDDRADALQAGASQFEASAGKLKRKFWWRNCKLLMVLCGILAVIAIVIIVAITSERRGTGSMNGSSPISSTNLSSDLPSFDELEGEESLASTQRDLRELQDETKPKSSFTYSNSGSNAVLPHGEETIPQFSSTSNHPNSQMMKSGLSPETPEEIVLDENSPTTP
nr:vesicle associated membrane protein 1 [Hymenolepis microstoma]